MSLDQNTADTTHCGLLMPFTLHSVLPLVFSKIHIRDIQQQAEALYWSKAGNWQILPAFMGVVGDIDAALGLSVMKAEEAQPLPTLCCWTSKRGLSLITFSCIPNSFPTTSDHARFSPPSLAIQGMSFFIVFRWPPHLIVRLTTRSGSLVIGEGVAVPFSWVMIMRTGGMRKRWVVILYYRICCLISYSGIPCLLGPMFNCVAGTDSKLAKMRGPLVFGVFRRRKGMFIFSSPRLLQLKWLSIRTYFDYW